MLPLRPLPPLLLLLTCVAVSSPFRKSRQTDYWGPWGEWGECSQTCGIGVTVRERRCFSNRRDGGSNCLGPLRDYRVCNVQDCPEGSHDFREEQCSAFDGTDFQGKQYKWLPYYGASNKCELNCIPRGENFYYRHGVAVKDGTLCEPGGRDICVQGVCKAMGCDNTLESLQTEDKCLECGGDGSSCSKVKATFDVVDLPKGYNQIHIIPIGATSIHIREVLPTRNYLAVKNVRGEHYLNGHWTIDPSRALHVAGTVLHYQRGAEGDGTPETLHGRGPTSEPLILEIISQDPNRGIEYEYYQSRNGAQPQGYFWSVGSWGPCNKECGGGFQTRLVSCTIDNEAYPDYLCQGHRRPRGNQTCNTQPCPRTRRLTFINPPRPWKQRECPTWREHSWRSGPWSGCSVTCGGGVQTRPVYCATMDGDTVGDEEECAAVRDKPHARQTCNPLKCTDWRPGPWSQCSVSCGGGHRTRAVPCVSSSGGQLPDFMCGSRPPPAASEPCEPRRCHDTHSWYIGAWGPCSVSCGEGLQSRPVSCMSQLGGQLLDSACSSQPRPSARQTCSRLACPPSYSWHVGAWGLCSKSCASGLRKRQVICYNQERNHWDPRQCDARRQPRDMEDCNTQSCYLPQAVPSFPDPTGFDPDDEPMTFPYVEYLPALDPYFPDFLPDRTETNLLPVALPPQGSDVARFYHHVPESDSPLSGRFGPGGRQELLGPERWDCHAEPYGCCPDGYAAADGPGGAGCPLIPCYKSRYGCCPDGVTSAQGLNQAGCPRHPAERLFEGTEPFSESRVAARNSAPDQCRASRYGCCQDETTLALGPEGEGCREQLSHSLPARCQLVSANGPCSDWVARWFFVPQPGACNRFWYGGCHGNRNNFPTEAECVRHCQKPDEGGAPDPQRWSPSSGRHQPPNRDPTPAPREAPSHRLQIDRSDVGTVSVRPGETARLPCRVQASPPPSVEWRRHGRPLLSLRHSKHPDGWLVISRVQPQDAGVYTCHVSDGRDQDFRQVELKVQGALRITTPPRDVRVDLGGRAELPCAVSDPQAHVRWTRNGVPLRVDTESAVVSLDGTLTLRNVQLADSGTYTCNAYSGSRAVSASADLTVISTETVMHSAAPEPLCVDLPELANCDLIIKANLCSNQYHASFCCASCSRQPTGDGPVQQG
ncbi:LOW QUALITY PROTEIN: papilin-like [Leucoraja erinacea]|uniref:LOW QUALITY PROTEIN: papilin-like n=1 Tax=Leucoraja erinaceus TaxID=7782 RepID=UPI0024590D7E|nr:LOW QUALITY PROTEIN: papilin-like [Leucoraja erinacea]